MIVFHGWVVTHYDSHDDEESAERAITYRATNAHTAWVEFLGLVGGERKTWNDRGYVARRVTITVEFGK